MISKERMHELAVEIGAARANAALDNTHAMFIFARIENLDDFAPMTVAELRDAAEQIAEHIRSGRATVVYPADFLGKGDGEPVQVDEPRPLQKRDRVRLIAPVGPYGIGCEGTITGHGIGPRAGSFVVVIDGAMETICPASALERIEAPDVAGNAPNAMGVEL